MLVIALIRQGSEILDQTEYELSILQFYPSTTLDNRNEESFYNILNSNN